MSAGSLKVISLAAIVLVGASTPAYAYLDPGTGTMLLQGIIAAFAAGAAVLSVKFTQLKQLAKRILKREGSPTAAAGKNTDSA